MIVLRLGHRRDRDKRVTTHLCLVSRVLGVEKVIYTGEKDENMEKSVEKVVESWGGPFSVEYTKQWKKVIEDFDGVKVHLTMYGLPFQEKINEIDKNKNLLIIVGSEKVPGEVYKMVDYNIAVGNQPHSEISALAIFLYELNGRKLKEKFENAKIFIEPCERCKKVKKKEECSEKEQ